MRHVFLVAAAGALLSSMGQLAAALNDEIITDAEAQRYGLTRMWVTQAQVNRAQGRLQAVVLYDGVLYAQSNRATLEAIDAETGQKLWAKMIGEPSQPNLPPSVCRDLVATINGSTLFVMNRYTGDILYHTLVNGAVGGGPALSNWIPGGANPIPARAYVPTVTGVVLSYCLGPVTDPAKELGKIDPHAAAMEDDEKKEAAKKAEEERRENIRIRQDYIPPLACSSYGRALVAPVVTTQNRDEEFVTWVTDRGYVYVGRIDRRSEDLFVSKYRLASNGTFSNPPAYLPPDPKKLGDSGVIYAGSSDGFVYAMLERGGDLQWKFATSDPVIDSPVVIEDRVYATTELGGMFCINAKTGKQVWWAPEIMHFVAAGKHRVYAADKLDRLRILDARSGATLDSIPTSSLPIKVSNSQTDRIYLATEGGMIQCLRELELTSPVAYNESRKPLPDDEQSKPPPKLKPKSSADGAPKVAHDRPAPRRSPARKTKPRRTMLPGSVMPILPTSPTSPPNRSRAKWPPVSRPRQNAVKAKADAAKAKADAGKKDAPANAGGGDDPFGGK